MMTVENALKTQLLRVTPCVENEDIETLEHELGMCSRLESMDFFGD